MPARKGLLAPQNTFLDTIATRFDGTHSNFVLGNAKIAKVYPIVYCSDGFCDLTGYSRAQIMQKSCACNFLYGQKTDVQNREAISRALEQKQELKLEVILYRSSGTPFWCLLDIVPIQDEKHEVVLFLCSHKDITKQKLHEQQQHQLAQLQAQKQQQIAEHQHQLQHPHQQPASGAATGAATGTTAGDGAGTETTGAKGSPPTGTQRETDAQHPAADGAYLAGANTTTTQATRLEGADEAELTAMANQNALISMDEFGLEDSANDQDFDDGDDSEDHDKHTASQYSRRRSRAVLYQLSGHYGYRRSVNMKSKLKLNNRMNIPEYKTTTIEKQRFILSHYGVGKSCWDWLILVVSFYVAIVVPYNATFKEKHQDLTGECKIDSIDILVEVVFVIDVILNFRTTFVNRKGEVVTQPKIICKHYVRGWFIVDACAALPFDLLCSLNLYNRSRLDLNLLKLIRLLRLARLLQKMDRYSQYSYIILTLLMLIFSLLAHWCACIWYVIAMEEIERNPPEWKIGWIHQLSDKLGYSVVNTTDMASSYVTALYFTTSSLTSVGFGNVSANTNAEKIFSIVIMLIGALMHAVVFGNVTALIRVMYARRSNYQTRLRDLKDFFRLHQLPKELQQRMSDYFQTTWSLNHGIETYEILKDFPEELRGDVSLHLHREVLSLPIFETAPQGFLKSLARHIESKFCCPTEYLIHRGDALSYLYLVCNGSMEVLQDNMVVAILGKGDLVGYDVNAVATPEHTQYGLSKVAASMLGGSMAGLVKSSSDLKALTYCDLKCIHISGLLDVLKLYPEFSDTFHAEIIHDLTFNLRETHDEPSEEGGEEETEEEEEEEEDGEHGDGSDAEHAANGGNGTAGASNGNGGGRNGRRSSPPPPNMGHLFRSITAGNENQIGRYDDDDDVDDEHEHDVDELSEEEEDQDEEDEDEEEEEADDDDEDDGDERPPPGPDDGHGGGGGGGGSSGGPARRLSDSSDGSAGNRHRARGGHQRGEPNGDGSSGRLVNCIGSRGSGGGPSAAARSGQTSELEAASIKAMELRNLDGWRRRGDLAKRCGGGSTKELLSCDADGDDEEEEEVGSVGGPASSSMSRQTSGGGGCGGGEGDHAATAIKAADALGRSGLRRRVCRAAQEDWQSAHSYDGLLDCRRRKKLASSGLSRLISKNNSDDAMATTSTLLTADHQRQRGPGAGLVGSTLSCPLRSAIGRGGGGAGLGNASALTPRKPPLSFDLSRNTTAIVDRRRRSAGCIPRPLLIGAASGAGTSSAAATATPAARRAGHSSLTHINENQSLPSPGRRHVPHNNNNKRSSGASSAQQQRTRQRAAAPTNKLAPDRTGQQQQQQHQQRATAANDETSRTAPSHRGQSNGSKNQELRNIDACIMGLSASVKEMKQELRQELNQFRGAMQLLMRLVDKQQQPTTAAAAAPGTATTPMAAAAAAAANGHSVQPNYVQSSISLASTSTRQSAPADCQTIEDDDGGGSGGGGGGSAGAAFQLSADAVAAALAKGPLLRSQSATSLPFGSSSSSLLSDRLALATTTADGGLSSPLMQAPRLGLFKQQQQHSHLLLAATTSCSRQSVLHEEEAGADNEQQRQQAHVRLDRISESIRERGGSGGDGGNRQTQSQRHYHQQQQQQSAPIFIPPSNQQSAAQSMTTATTTATRSGQVDSRAPAGMDPYLPPPQPPQPPPPPVTPTGQLQQQQQQQTPGAPLRPVSQCSSSPLAGLRQSSSGANLNSDNDSGRSTSSVNSSTNLVGQRNGAAAGNGCGGAQVAAAALAKEEPCLPPPIVAKQLIIQADNTVAAAASYHTVELSSPATSLRSQGLPIETAPQLSGRQLSGGRPAKMLVTTELGSGGGGGQAQPESQRYTIDIGPGASCPATATADQQHQLLDGRHGAVSTKGRGLNAGPGTSIV